jgi:rRNA maturation endonuclease Nob1
MRLANIHTGMPLEISYVHYVGKCDRCGRFHVRCTTCGAILSLPEDDDSDCGHQCGCKMPWFWLASVEEDEDRRKSAELHLVRAPGVVETVDRRAL